MIRLRRLDLDLFGRFTAQSYDFGPAPQGADFHIIYGPNEAGKTTTMEGFLRLLYGFPARDPYGFLHDRKNLKITGTVDVDGTEQTLTRLPTRAANLLDAQGNPLPETFWQARLGGLGPDDYRQLLCLDDATIESGGEQIASSRGDIGKLLFSAAAGVSDLTGVLDKLRGDADALYKKRASSTEMAQLKTALKEVEQQIKALDVTASAYHRLKQELDTARTAEDALCADTQALRRRLAMAEAQARALPLLSEIDRLDADLAAHRDMPAHLDLNPETLVKLLSQQSLAQADLERLEGELTELALRQGALVRHPDALSLGADLAALAELHSRHVTADLDLHRRRGTLDELRADMDLVARDLGAKGADPMALVPTQAQLAELSQALDAARETTRDLAAEQAAVSRLSSRLDTAQAALAGLSQGAPEPSGVGDILARFRADRLAPDHAAARAAIKSGTARLRDALDALNLQGLCFDTVPPCPLSALEAGDLASRHRALAGKLDTARDALRAHLAEADSLHAKTALLTDAQGVLTDAEAARATAERDTLWQQHRAVLDTETADAFAAAMVRVDALATARLTHAADLARLRQMADRQADLTAATAQTKAQIDALQSDLDAVLAPLRAAAAAVGLPEDTAPNLMADWTARRDLAAQAARSLAATQAEQAPVLDKAARFLAALAPHLALDTPDFDTALDAARALQGAELDAAKRTATARADRDALRTELAERSAHLKTLTQTAEAAQAAWATQVRQIFGTALPADALLHGLAPLHKLHGLAQQHRDLSRQIKGMAQDQAAFTARINALAKAHALPDAAPLDQHRALTELADAASQAEAAHQQIGAAIAKAETMRSAAQNTLTQIAAQVAQQAQIFPAHVPTETLAELRQAVTMAQDIITRRARRNELAAQICNALGTNDTNAARAALVDTDSATLAAEIAGLQAEIDGQEQHQRSAIEARTTAQNALAAVTGSADVAELTERRATLEAQIEDCALRYLELDLGHRLATEAIRRYRDSHRGAMMEATEAAFAELTNGAYTRLMTRPDGQTETLLAQDAFGTAKEAKDMSKGTRFQLYLALRAAAYEQLTAQGTCLPFFCDDIFETFDEDRTRAACRLMARIGRSGQAIYLTHHRHVVDIARAECGADVMIHHINSGS